MTAITIKGNLAADPSVLAPAAQARAVVTNSNDHANATCTLLAREYGFTGHYSAVRRMLDRLKAAKRPTADGEAIWKAYHK